MGKEISVPFRGDMVEAIVARQKICTSRNKKYGNRGDYFYLCDRKVRCTLVIIEKNLLEYVANKCYSQEGFESPSEFKEVWSELHPKKGFKPGDIVWTHWFGVEILDGLV